MSNSVKPCPTHFSWGGEKFSRGLRPRGYGPGYYFHKKGVYVEVIRSTVRRYFRGRQHSPAWKCLYPKNKSTKNASNHESL